MTKPKHPAPYTPAIVDLVLEKVGDRRGLFVDPMAGLGLHLPKFVRPGRRVVGIEIERPWVEVGGAATAGIMEHGDATNLRFRARSVKTLFTSPSYGNRFSDKHRARDQSRRRSYTHDIREQTGDSDYTLDPNNTGGLPYGPLYQQVHRDIYAELWRVAAPGCEWYLNVSDFIRDSERVPSAVWHLATNVAFGWEWHNAWLVDTPRNGHGQNRDARVDGEWVYKLVKP